MKEIENFMRKKRKQQKLSGKRDHLNGSSEEVECLNFGNVGEEENFAENDPLANRDSEESQMPKKK